MDHPLYAEHLDFLYDGGRQMAEAYPRIANLLAKVGYDPDVERLLEGLAFIGSKVSEKQAESLHEVCQLLFETLFPHYVAPVPAATILELTQAPDAAPRVMERGTEVQSVPVLGTPCRFRTTHDVVLAGVQLRDLRWQSAGGMTQLTLSFDSGAWLTSPELPDRLRLFLHGESLLTRSLYEWLMRAVDRVELLDQSGRTEATSGLRPRPVGFAPEEALLDYPPGAFEGFRIIQEYLTLPQKFMFVDLDGVREEISRQGVDTTGGFTLRITMRASAESLVVTRQNVRLGCTPAVNLFEHAGDPIRREPAKVDYRVRPSGPHLHYEIVRVLQVLGLARGRSTRYPLLSEQDLERAESGCVQLRSRLFEGERHTYLSVQDPPHQLPREETLALDLLCSNGQLPTALGVGDIADLRCDGDPVRASNVLPPTRPLAPPLGDELRRRLVRHLALSQRDLTDLVSLRDVLHLYDLRILVSPQARRAHDLVLEAMIEATTEEVQHRRAGVVIWGQATRLVVDERHFNAGELYLLGAVLNEWVALQAPINTFSQFSLFRAQIQEELRWPKRIGRSALTR